MTTGFWVCLTFGAVSVALLLYGICLCIYGLVVIKQQLQVLIAAVNGITAALNAARSPVIEAVGSRTVTIESGELVLVNSGLGKPSGIP